MSSDAVAFRFPEGTQFRMTTDPPRVGEVLREGGRAWVVVAVGEDDLGHTAVVLEPVAAPARADS
jgi:hypothetical protein